MPVGSTPPGLPPLHHRDSPTSAHPVLGIEPKALCILGKGSTKLLPSAWVLWQADCQQDTRQPAPSLEEERSLKGGWSPLKSVRIVFPGSSRELARLESAACRLGVVPSCRWRKGLPPDVPGPALRQVYGLLFEH